MAASPALLTLLKSSEQHQTEQQRTSDDIEQEVLRQFDQLWRATKEGQGAIQQLPQLYTPAPKPETLHGIIHEQARLRKLQMQAKLCLDESDLRDLEMILEDNAVLGQGPGIEPSEPRINYDNFCLAKGDAEVRFGPGGLYPAVAQFFQASTFLKFERDTAGAISLPLFLQYVARRVQCSKLRVQLAHYDESGSGVLDLQQLQQYLGDIAAAAPLLAGMDPTFLPHYLQIASRKLLLFHGRRSRQQQQPQRRQSLPCRSSGGCGLVIKLSDLVNSPVMAELQELLSLGPGQDQEKDLFNNWFSLQSAQRVHATFTSWDLDGNGTLSKQEFSAISQGAMSELFIARVFEEHVAPQRGAAWPPQPQRPAKAPTSPSSPSKLGSLPSIGHRSAGSSPPPYSSYSNSSSTRPMSPASASTAGSSGAVRVWPPPLPPNAAGPRDEMDLLAFADFVLAWDHRNHPAAVPYFFKIFDIQHRGYLTLQDLYTFFKEIHSLWVAMGEYADLDIYDVLDEIMDMVKPAQPGKITKADLENCKMAGVVFGMLANVDQFYQYNYRENFMQQEGEDA